MGLNSATNGRSNQDAYSYRPQPTERGIVAAEKTHCWFCNKPLNGFRRFCSKECEEAIYEDNDTATKRRMIFGCRC